jgi:hypothetical protein
MNHIFYDPKPFKRLFTYVPFKANLLRTLVLGNTKGNCTQCPIVPTHTYPIDIPRILQDLNLYQKPNQAWSPMLLKLLHHLILFS